MKFDAVTSIEEALMRNGYKRYKTVSVKKDGKTSWELVEMKPYGDNEYYFSSMQHIDFTYIKGDVTFVVGLRIKGDPPVLVYVGKSGEKYEIPFVGGESTKGLYPMLLERVYKHVGEDKFIEAIENGEPMNVPELSKWRKEVVSVYAERAKAEYQSKMPKQTIESKYTYQSQTCAY